VSHDASSILGAAQLAGVKVNPLGLSQRIRKHSVAVGGGVAVDTVSTAILQAIGRKGEKKLAAEIAEARTPQFGRLAWLAVTENEVALVELKQHGLVNLRLEGVIERVPRGEVTGAELGGGHTLYSPPLTITFAGDYYWALEVPRPSKKAAKEVVDTLGG
jgi:hypothetical protein